MTPDVLIGLLAEPVRMRVFAAVVLGASTAAEVARRSGTTPRQALASLRRLTDGGLVATVDGALVAKIDAFKQTVREGNLSRPNEALDPDATRAAVLRAFVVNGQLVSIPAAHGKRRVVLEHIVGLFEPGVRYPEREVDAVLRAWHPDHAALRRHLIDEDLMARDRGIYWRIGGPVL
jgi:hypothetical protein